ncbi:hypothetical protein BKA93DRAFT_747325 [Sparassis latifolia]
MTECRLCPASHRQTDASVDFSFDYTSQFGVFLTAVGVEESGIALRQTCCGSPTENSGVGMFDGIFLAQSDVVRRLRRRLRVVCAGVPAMTECSERQRGSYSWTLPPLRTVSFPTAICRPLSATRRRDQGILARPEAAMLGTRDFETSGPGQSLGFALSNFAVHHDPEQPSFAI